VTDTTTNALDAMTNALAPFAQKWGEEADRRLKLRTPENLKALMDAQKAHNSARTTAAQAKTQRATARKESSNPLSTARRAARTAYKAARAHRAEAEAKLRQAKASYPATLTARAVQTHASHAVPSSLASYVLSTPQDWTLWPASVSAGLIALHAGALWLGRRSLSVQVYEDDGLTLEERQLMERLDPAFWVAHASDRGLDGTVTTPPQITVGGIQCDVRLDGKWTVKAMNEKADSVRNLLGARTALRMRITSGTRGGWAKITLATRSAADHTSSAWTPALMPADRSMVSLGLDTETGETVHIPFDERLLVAGASGTGKSWSTRPLLAHAHLNGDLIVIDGKGEEANIWEKVCRVAIEADEIEAAIDEVHAEMMRRKSVMKRRGISVWDGTQLTLLVDEGQVVLAMVKDDKDRLQRLIELSSLGRSRGIVLWWATQKPIMSGNSAGVHNLIAPNLLTRFSLRVADQQEAQTALDDCADYAPHKIPPDRSYRGHGYLKGYGSRLIRTWTLDDDGIRRLPQKSWSKGGPTPVQLPAQDHEPTDRPALQLVPPVDRAPATNRDRVLEALREGASRNKEIEEVTGLNSGTVSSIVNKLVKDGVAIRQSRGPIRLVEKPVAEPKPAPVLLTKGSEA
jgi:S-DNA-T family DNA segregation ATPase FtsK/SpoIIIE